MKLAAIVSAYLESLGLIPPAKPQPQPLPPVQGEEMTAEELKAWLGSNGAGDGVRFDSEGGFKVME